MTRSNRITLPDRGAEVLFDLQDKNIRFLEGLFEVEIHARGDTLSIQGSQANVDVVEKMLRDFSNLVGRGEQFSNGALREAFEQIAQGSAGTLHDFFPKPVVLKTPSRTIVPRSVNQNRYVAKMEASDLVMAIGPAGTGKTFLAVAKAIAFLLERKVDRIILSRPAVEAGEKLGFLPGDLQEKVDPYLRPLYDALFFMLDAARVEQFLERRIIEIAPLAFMRGRTLSNCFVILDEAQNSSVEQMKMFVTRMGLHSKMVVTGDVTQIDLPPGQVSGLKDAERVLKGTEGIEFAYFDERDVVRHRLVRLIITAYENQNQSRGKSKD